MRELTDTQDVLDLFWQDIVNTMSEGLMLVGPNGGIRFFNRALRELTGYTNGEISGLSCNMFNCDTCEMIKGEQAGAWCRMFDPEYGPIERVRCRLMKKDGTYISVLKNARQLKDAAGCVIGVVETLTDITDLENRERRIEELTRRLDREDGFHGMIGRSEAMRRTFDILTKAALSDGPILLQGDSGTGKELAARAIHAMRVPAGPFIQLNCAALNEGLLESELFGHVKGAFTGAYRHRLGRFEAAHGGDLFLDEIGDMPPALQAKLLRVLETKQVERVGDHRPVTVDVRVVAATHRDLAELTARKAFRQDLFFRINIIPIHLPALRERTDDIPLLVEHFIHRLAVNHPKDIHGVEGAVLDYFFRYDWPGNVRELKGLLEYAWVIADRGLIKVDHLPPQHRRRAEGGSDMNDGADDVVCAEAPVRGRDFADKKAALVEALRRTGGNQSEAARCLGISRVSVWKWMRKYGLDPDAFKS